MIDLGAALGILGGVLWLALFGGCVLHFCASLLIDRQQGVRLDELATDLGALTVAVTCVLVAVLGFLQLLSLASVSLAALALGAAGLRRPERAAWRLLRSVFAAGLRRLFTSPALAVVGVLGLLTLARGLATPQGAWDGLIYHLAYAGAWVQHGGIVPMTGGGYWASYDTFPKGAETLWYIAMLPFHHDHLVNLVNLPLWFLCAVAARACVRRLGGGDSVADSAALVLVANPVLFAYVTPAYVEVFKVFALLAGTSAACRALLGQPSALLPMAVAFGLALSVKLTTLTWAGPAVLVFLWCAREHPGETLRRVLPAVAIVLIIAGPWYANNALRCDGNPIYPAGLPGASVGARAGSATLAWVMRDTSVVAMRAFGAVAEELLRWPLGRYHPQGPGWLAVLTLLAMAPLSLLARADARRRALPLVALSLLLLTVYLVTPFNGLSIVGNGRFLAPCVAASVIACAVALAGLPAWLRRAAGAVAALVTALHLVRAPTLHDAVIAAPATLTALGCAGVLLFARRVLDGGRAARVALASAAVFVLGSLPLALADRDVHRFERLYDLHPVFSDSRALWPAIAKLPPGRIALAVGGRGALDGWFVFPLMGPDLRHDYSYVDIEKGPVRNSCQRRGQIREAPDEASWLRRIERGDIDYLVTFNDVIEQRWAAEHPERFTLLQDISAKRLYRVTR